MTLRSKPILDAMVENNIDDTFEWRKPLFLGVIFWCLIIGMSIWFYYGSHGEKMQLAISNQFGIEYKSWIHGFRTGTGGTKAKVYIYNRHEYKEISVEYDDDSEVTITENQ